MYVVTGTSAGCSFNCPKMGMIADKKSAKENWVYAMLNYLKIPPLALRQGAVLNLYYNLPKLKPTLAKGTMNVVVSVK